MPVTILVIIFWQFTVFLLKFVSPQVKRDLVSSITNFVIWVVSHVAEQLKTSDLRKLGNSTKILNLRGIETSVQSPLQKFFFRTSDQNLLKSRYQSFLALPNFFMVAVTHLEKSSTTDLWTSKSSIFTCHWLSIRICLPLLHKEFRKV